MTVTRVSQSLCVPQHIVFEQNEQKKKPVWQNTKLGEESVRRGQSVHRTSGFKGRLGLVSSPKNVRLSRPLTW